MSRTNVRGSLILFITALIWGAAFVAQKIGTVELDAFTFVSARFFISGIALLPVALFRGRHSNTGGIGDGETKPRAKTLFAGGIACGVCLAFASVAQQTGMEETTAGKAGFITALYILFVPVFRFFGGKKVTAAVWLSVLAALAGFYLLCVKEGFSVGAGDAFVLLSALLFTAHILVIDRFSPCADGIQMSCIQFFVASAVSAIPMLLFEKPDFHTILSSWAPLLYLGIVSGGIGYTLQIIGQKSTDPAVASLILSLESVFAAISGVIFLKERFIGREIAGCALVFAATIVSQLNIREIVLKLKRHGRQSSL